MRVLARGLVVMAVLTLGVAGRAAAASDQYLAHNLVSSSAAVSADRVDPNLVNPWGLVSSATSPWWTSNNGTDTSTLYNALGVPSPLVVAVPTAPTGIVFGGIAGAFPTTGGNSNFIFSTEGGGIYGWRTGTAAPQQASHPGAIYKGLAISTANGPRIYATDFHNGAVDVYDATWARVDTAGKFIDPTLPTGFAPYGIQTIGNRIFVTYAKQDADAEDEIPGAGLGYVSAFDAAGNFLARVASAGPLSAPWGVAQAPPNWGAFGGDLLIGNFGDGRINAYRETTPGTWTLDGTLQSALDGRPLTIIGLWALQFGAGGANNGPVNALYYTAGPFAESEGAFGRILSAAGAPGTVSADVPAQLALTLGDPASFGAFRPGAAGDYAAATTATVVSTAGDAALSVTDPSPNFPGHLVNGAFSLPQALQASATSAGGTGAAFAPIGGSPATLLTYAGPVSNDAVTLNFQQAIGANDALRTGTYSKTLTFTLSTTNP